jgi:uncharacterized protein
MQTILITGGTGLLGTALTTMLVQKGYKVIILSRTEKQSQNPNVSFKVWNIAKQFIDPNAIAEADHIIHLAGAGIAEKRWTAERKNEIEKSRVESGKLLVSAIKSQSHKIQTLVSASGAGYYGADNGVPFTETMPANNDFLGNTCQNWENATQEIETLNIRRVILRISVVLCKNGGALKEFLTPLKFRLATTLGSGKQITSWVHIADLCNSFIFAIENKSVNGIYNIATSQPVSNHQLITALAKQKYGNYFLPIPVPAFMLKIMLGQMSQIILKSVTVNNQKSLDAGFVYFYNNIEDALKNIVEQNA